MAIDESKQQQIGAENSNTKCVGPDSVVIADKSARIDLTDSLTGVIKGSYDIDLEKKKFLKIAVTLPTIAVQNKKEHDVLSTAIPCN